ncbi:MAG TPA: ATP-binding protein [Minicystis sp.]|nr:ATP-binding protein [Minicystis sp.]
MNAARPKRGRRSGDRPAVDGPGRPLEHKAAALEVACARLARDVARLRALVAASSDALELSTREGEVLSSSDAIQRMLGLAPRTRVGASVEARVHPEDVGEFAARRRACVATPGACVQTEQRMRHESGGYRHVIALHQNRLDDPDVAAVVSSYRDVTERRALEERYAQSQNMDAIGRLAGGIAHDFNNMLTVIGGVSRILIEELPAGDPMLGDLEEITMASDRAAALTRQLLAFGRKQVLKPRAVDLPAHLRDMVAMLRRVIGEDVALEMNPSPATWPVRVDPGQLEQVVLNLVVNARDAMPGGGKLTIETANVVLDREYVAAHVDVASGPFVLLAVTDTGHGMERRVLDHVFEPFFTTKEAGRGTGLGLATVFGIVKQSGGHVEAESEPGVGTTFRVYLPRSFDEPDAKVERPPRLAGLGGRETVLLVEDDALVRQYARKALQRHGYSVIEASNGGEAVLIVEEHEGPIHLLITDVVMPRLSGRRVAERIGRLRPGVRVLYMSGYSAEEVALRGGAADLLEKPIAPEALLRKVREVLDR